MNVWELPTALEVGGRFWKIRSDFRAVLDAISIFEDPILEIEEKWYVCLYILFEDFEDMPEELFGEASEKAVEFIDAGITSDNDRNKPSIMSWEQDASIIIPAINHVLGKEIRNENYMHWWTFTGAYMEIGESLFSNVIEIRSKRASGKKLTESEKEFIRNNKSLVILSKPLTEEEEQEKQERKEAINKLLGV